MPIVSGNVSLYNETNGEAILPTPTIGAVGLLASLDGVIPMAPGDGETLVLIGETKGHLGQSAWLWELHGKAEGDAPPVDLDAERRAGDLIRALKAKRLITAAHDLSDGGLAVAAAEMALAAGTGVTLEAAEQLSPPAWFTTFVCAITAAHSDISDSYAACASTTFDALVLLERYGSW